MAKIRKGQISFTAGEISPRLGMRNDLAKYDNALEECLNFIVSPYGALYRRPGIEYVADAKSNINSSVLIPFEFSTEEAYQLEMVDGVMRVFKNQAQVLSGGVPYELAIPYSNSELPSVRYTQSFNTLYLVHPDYPPKELVRISDNNWTITDITFDEPAYEDENSTNAEITPSGTTGFITVTSSTSIFASTDVSRAIRYKAGPDESDTTTYVGNGTQTNYDIPFFPNTAADIEVYLVTSSGSRNLQSNPADYSVSNGQVVMVAAPTVSQSIIIQPINAGSGEWGWMIIDTYVSGTEVTATVQRDLAGTNASSEWRLGAWSETTGYPQAVTIHEQRLWFAANADQPQTFWASEIGIYTNFQPDNILYKGGVDDDTSLTFTLGATKAQSIQWMASKGALLIGTANGIFSVEGVQGAAISALNVSARKQTDVGCAFKVVAETQNEILFIDKNKRRIYACSYLFEVDGYVATDLTLLSEHFGNESTIEEIAFNQEKDILWARRTDNNLLSCTYIKGQDVIGWAQHSIAGTDVSINAISVITGQVYEELWIHVGRTIDGGTKNYIEYMNDLFFLGDKEDAKFLDSMLTYDGVSTDTISGLDHLEGESVTVLGDGSVHPEVTVTGGSITLNYEVEKAQIGLNYVSNVWTLDLSGGSVIGTSQSATSRINEFSINFFETVGARIGYDASKTDLIQFRGVSDPMDQSPPLFTGYKSGRFPKGWDNAYKVYMTQEQPYPMTVLGMIVTANISDN